VRVAAVQLEAEVADVAANLEACERLADRAGEAGAECIVLPEFFTTGIGFVPELADAALPPDGEATELLRSLARRHGALVGGSFLCRDRDGETRNAFLLATPDGEIAGRHDKDLPTMWENAFYVGGSDDGVIKADEISVGAAVCWELMRTQTARRLRGRVDLLLTGSGWWSIPEWPLAGIGRRLEAGNAALARRAARGFCLYVGAPLVHAAHAGALRCEMPWAPLDYQGHFEGATLVCAADGTVLAARDKGEGEGFVVAEVTPGRSAPRRPIPSRFWLHRRPPVTAFTWWYQRLHGKPWYERNVAGRAAASRRERVPA
jgi:predicted amidohydrolase